MAGRTVLSAAAGRITRVYSSFNILIKTAVVIEKCQALSLSWPCWLRERIVESMGYGKLENENGKYLFAAQRTSPNDRETKPKVK